MAPATVGGHMRFGIRIPVAAVHVGTRKRCGRVAADPPGVWPLSAGPGEPSYGATGVRYDFFRSAL